MTYDIVALCGSQPTPAIMLGAMHAAGTHLHVNTIEEAQLIQLYHPDGRLMLTTEGARLVQVPGEAKRLLGIDVPNPVWWVESRAPSGDPEAEDVTKRFAQALVTATGGALWSTR